MNSRLVAIEDDRLQVHDDITYLSLRHLTREFIRWCLEKNDVHRVRVFPLDGVRILVELDSFQTNPWEITNRAYEMELVCVNEEERNSGRSIREYVYEGEQ